MSARDSDELEIIGDERALVLVEYGEARPMFKFDENLSTSTIADNRSLCLDALEDAVEGCWENTIN